MKSWFVDDFNNYNTCTILGSKQPTNLEKERIFKVIEYIATSSVPNIAIPNSNVMHNLIIESIRQDMTNIEKYDYLKSKIEGCETNECLLMHVARTYGLTPKSLLMETIAIHSRIKKLDHKDAWFDNFSLNSFLLQLTTIVYSEYDKNVDPFVKSLTFNPNINQIPHAQLIKSNSESVTKKSKPKYKKSPTLSGGDVVNMIQYNDSNEDDEIEQEIINMRNLIYTLETKSKFRKIKHSLIGGELSNSTNLEGGANPGSSNLINESVKLTNPLQLLMHLGNNYRCFIEFGLPADKVVDNEKAIKLLDALNSKYPYYTGCTHGCDVFTSDFREKSVSIADIHEFCQRYPYSIVGYILNTKTYKSGRGQHWMALIFKHNTAYLICSQGSGFNAFEEKTLERDLEECGFSKEWNPKTIQIDHSSCGMYSVLSNLSFIMNGGGNRKPIIKDIVNMIGEEAKGINAEGIYSIKQKLAGFAKK